MLLVSDGSAAWSLEDGCGKDSWLLLPGEVADAAAHLLEPENDRSIISAAEVDDVQRQVLGLAARLAQKPEVQRALLQELGLEGDAPTSLLLPAGEESTAVLRQIVAQLKLENEALQAANVAAREKLAASDGDSAHKTMIRQLEAQNAALQLMSSTNSLEADWQDPARDVHDLFETLGRGTDCDEQDADGAGAAVAAACADGASARAAAMAAQEQADFELAQRLNKELNQDLHAPEYTKPSPDLREETCEATLLETALAVAGILVLFALTRRMSPALARRAAALSAATVAGLVAAFKKGRC